MKKLAIIIIILNVSTTDNISFVSNDYDLAQKIINNSNKFRYDIIKNYPLPRRSLNENNLTDLNQTLESLNINSQHDLSKKQNSLN